jgi:hypothetical protein
MAMARLSQLWLCAVLMMLLTTSGSSTCLGTTLYVAPNGNDAWSGTLVEPNAAKTDGCFASLVRAREEIRRIKRKSGLPKGGIVVEIRGGVYQLTSPLSLSAEDSGDEGSTVVWRARAGEKARITGGVQVTTFTPVTDPAVLKRLDESARGHVLQADLNGLGAKSLGLAAGPDDENHNRLELFFQDKPMTLARWPNTGFTHIKDVDDSNGNPVKLGRGNMRTSEIGRFIYEGEHPSRWAGEEDVWLHGCWFYEWADSREKVESIDTTRHVITLTTPCTSRRFRQGQGYYAFNLLSELDTPGEWYFDRRSNILYFWPPAPLDQGKVVVSVAPMLVFMLDASHVTLRGLMFEACQGDAIVARNVDDIQIVGCTIRNTGRWAIGMTGKNCRVAGCDMYEMGYGGIHFTGGDRKTLTPGKCVIDNNHFHHYSRWKRLMKPGISMGGVGNIASHNLFHNAPHQAIWWNGNDHVIEYNEIHSVCYEANDGGAIYAGEDWTQRGTVVRYNYLHHLSGFEGHGCLGVYLDDELSGIEVRGNLFYKVTNACNADVPAVSTCGRDCRFVNNIFVDCHPAVDVSTRRGAKWFETLKSKLDQVPYQSPLWASRYPKLRNILDDDPMLPKGNVIARNICVGGKWATLVKEAEPLVRFQDNLVDQDPHFVDAEQDNFQLKDDSPAWKLGFQRIPLEKIGLYQSPERASWPVSHTVRPAAIPPAK